MGEDVKGVVHEMIDFAYTFEKPVLIKYRFVSNSYK